MNFIAFDNAVAKTNNVSTDKQADAFITEQTLQVFTATYNAIIASLINASILVYVLWPVVNHHILILWLTSVLIISLIRTGFIYQYKKSNHIPQKAYFWLNGYLAGTIIAAFYWAAASIWMFPATDIARQVFLAFVVGGMGAGVITSMSHVRLAINTFLCVSLLPLIIRFYVSNSELSTSMATMLSLHLIMCLVSANRSHAHIKQNINLRVDVHEKERSLQQSEQRYKTLLEKVTDAFFLHDLHGRFLEVNQQACRSLGYSRDELLNMSVSDIELGRNKEELMQMWQALESGEATLVEGVYRRKDGTIFPVEVSIGAVQIVEQHLISISVRDISERKQAELAIQAKTEQLETVISKAPLILWSINQDGIFTFSDGLGLQGLGLKPGEVLGHSVFELYAEYTEIIESCCRALSGESFFNISSVADHYYETHYTPAYDEYGQIAGCIGVSVDITERILAERQIKELARFPEEALSPIFKVTGNGILSYANPASEMVRKQWMLDTGDKVPDKFSAIVVNAIETESPLECILHCSDKVYNMILVPVLELDAVYVYGLDITQQQKIQAELRKHKEHLEEMVEKRTSELVEATELARQASKAKSRFLSNMSHEIRTPLSSIIGFAEILAEGEKINDEQDKAIATILSSSQHLQNIINGILDLSKIEANKMEVERLPINLLEMLQEIETLIRLQAENKGLLLSIDLSNEVPDTINSDPVRIKQILLNLCSNAIKFTNEGEIKLDVDVSDDGKDLTIQVKDTGIGLTTAQMDNLFKAFSQADSSTTRKYGGTGLGLILSRQLAELLGGSLVVSSEYGRGSTFKLVLPVGDVEAEVNNENSSVSVKTEQPEMILLQGRVLLVEDTPPMRDLIGMHLTRIGLEYDIAENGQVALEKAKSDNFDLILMDIQMPVMGGIEATKILRASRYEKPIVALTANAMDKDKDDCLAAGCDDFVTKPINRQRLYNIASYYLKTAANN